MENDIGRKANIVTPTKGRDKGRLFFVIDSEERHLYLADGRMRKLEKPKRKNIRHVAATDLDGGRAAQKLRSGENVTNSELRKALSSLETILPTENISQKESGSEKEGGQFAERGSD